MTVSCCPVAYPVALANPAGLGAVRRFSCDSSLGSTAAAMIRLGKPVSVSETPAAHGVEADHVKVWQTVGKLRRRHELVMSGEPREPGYRVVDWLWEAKRVPQFGSLEICAPGISQGVTDSLLSIASMMRSSEASVRSGSTPSRSEANQSRISIQPMAKAEISPDVGRSRSRESRSLPATKRRRGRRTEGLGRRVRTRAQSEHRR